MDKDANEKRIAELKREIAIRKAREPFLDDVDPWEKLRQQSNPEPQTREWPADAVIFKRYELQESSDMPEQTNADAWNKWACALIADTVTPLARDLGEVIGRQQKEIQNLQDLVSQLKTKVEVLSNRKWWR